jgi:Fe-S cluster assembly protein SufD
MSQLPSNENMISKTNLDVEVSDLFPELVKSSLNQLNEIGFPTRKTEDWRYTKTSSLLKRNYKTSGISNNLQLEYEILNKLKSPTIVVENGSINTSLSCIGAIDGLSVTPFNEIDSKKSNKIGSISEPYEHAFSLLNISHLQNGIFINLDKKIVLKDPLHVVFINSEKQVFSNTRLFIHIGEFAEMKIIQSFINNQNQDAFSNHVTEAELDNNSSLSIEKIQDVKGESHICSEFIKQHSSTTFRINSLASSGNLIRNGLNINVVGENCNSYLNGLFIPSDKEHMDNHTYLDHAKPNCFSSECYKGILKDKAVGVFNGKVVVHQDAQKIMAYQQNNNLLLSDDAVINSKPELEIYADDVKCSHGSTTGQLDQEALFYLQSRGISRESAIQLLMVGFVEEVIDQIQVSEIKEFFSDKISSLLLSN